MSDTKQATQPVFEVRELQKYFPLDRGMRFSKGAVAKAVDKVSFRLERGRILGLVGESGCGKTTTGRVALRLLSPTGGRIFLDGHDITTTRDLKALRKQIQFVFQDPYSSLDARMSIYRILKEPLDNLFVGMSRVEKKERIAQMLGKVGLLPDHLGRFPHEFSGGQRQRIAIARALISEPQIVILDEPVSALDVSIQAQILNLLRKLQQSLGVSLIFISHDLAVVRHLCDEVAVMYLGRIVESSPSQRLYENPLHPYTEALLSAVPIPDPDLERQRQTKYLGGDVPSPLAVPSGCTFHPRCPLADGQCRKVRPALAEVESGHMVACLKRNAS
ncbi:MAG: ATP-binding cassette domain-containing protein [Desulfarculaceae bacterium]|nr:ATP-binding cassette domain-containing protein [Desulfarculaceae bacterium]